MKLEELLKSYAGQRIYYKPNPGNGGDALIAFAAHLLFQKYRIEYNMVKDGDDLKDKVVFFGGGGNLVELYNHCADFIRDHCKSVAKFILLPHTINGHEDLLSGLGSNFIIFCRESKSYEYVRSFKNLEHVYLSHDLVLDLQPRENFAHLKPAPWLIPLVKPRHILSAIYKGKRSWGYYLKRRNTSPVLNAFREDAELSSIERPSDNVDVTGLINLDESMLDMSRVKETSHRIFRFIDQFDVVNTNRLHICISSALLGKEVNFYDNSYYKNKSVYEHSIKDRFSNVNWKGAV